LGADKISGQWIAMGKNWAITIGINQYNNLTPLNYAKSDAEAMRDFCLQDMGFERVSYFSDDSEPIASDNGPPLKSQPTFATLSRFLRTRFEQPFLNAGDNLWFFFAGHGRRHKDRDYLMPIDVDPGNIEQTAIPIHDVTERLRRCGADNVILLLDACRNEGARDGEGIGIETQQGVVTLFSCSPNERSYEIEALQQGAFTHALLKGLRLQGEGDCATVERLDQFLRYQVPRLNQKYQKPIQSPYVSAEPATKLHLILLPKQARPKDVETLKKDALTAEVRQLFQQSKELWVRVLAVSPADSEAIEAIERLARLSTSTSPIPPTIETFVLPIEERSRGIHSEPKIEVESDRRRKEAELLRQRSIRLKEIDHQKRLDPQRIIELSQQRQLDQKNALARRQFLQKFMQFVGLGGVGSGGVWLIQRWMTSQLMAPKLPSSSPSSSVPSHKVSPSKLSLQPFKFDVVTVKAQGKKIKRQPGKANFSDEDLGNGVTLKMVSIPSGSFLMGSPKTEIERSEDEGPQHRVTVSEFFIGKYPVTQAQWKAVAALPKVKQDLESDPANFKGADRPVEQVAWDDAVEFCSRLSKKTGRKYRLPSEAEWEYACRARTTTPFHFGETLIPELAIYNGAFTYAQYRQQTTNVGSFQPNAFGLYDMHGNVWEWCQDLWHTSYTKAPSDGSPWLNQNDDGFRLLRGGSWGSSPGDCRSAYRNNDVTFGYRVNHLGFRVVCEAPKTL
jgi:formylglycine-generating enzyme required for sulfatase activity/uncharacterized caspase-like protein